MSHLGRSMRFLLGLFCVLTIGQALSFSSPSARYDDKPLNFSVENRTLSQVMEIFKQKTGVEYEIPGDLRGMSLPLVEIKNLTLKSALLKVLEGSNTDYILIASPTNPESIMKLLIIGKSSKIASSGVPSPGPTGHAMNRPPAVEDPFGSDMGVDEGQAEPAPVNVITPQPNPPPQGAQQNPMGVQPGQQPGPNQPIFPQLQPGQVQQQSTQPIPPINPYSTPDNRKSPY
jgi:hypothetical protein